ncbi:NUDIX domain-containing protein [Candidatus Pacearchaeota archaeon]|nr:NUDIX domain-containing protein [Candidatus Pacearchaeota archaeon]
MRYRRAVFIVTYARTKKEIEYLILKRKLHWRGWEFPKGAVKFLESSKQAVRRELKEETGLSSLKINKFDFSGKYNYKKIYSDRRNFKGQSFQLYSAEVKKEKIKLDNLEHSDYQWVGFKEALKKLTWPNQKKSLRIVNFWIING